ncbi:glycosyltransferase family 2 protein [Candidatus Uhrbacteria bacterium]|nr:glycosyltransferase family 2 protein [Candidatus Uhrbacteria bacterium]
MDATIQIVHYHSLGLLRETLRSLRRAVPRLTYEVIVVDNNPRQRLPASFAEEFPEARVLAASRHLGFGGGHNFASKKANGDFLIILNPDIMVVQGSLEELLKYAKSHPEAGLVAPRLHFPNGHIQYSCFRFRHTGLKLLGRTPFANLPWVKKRMDFHRMLDVSHDETMSVDWVLGACLCVPRDLWNRLGGFDERFLLYFEEVDFCRRVWHMGRHVVYHPLSVMLHYYQREGSGGSFFSQLCSRANWIHLASWAKYLHKYFRTKSPCR